MNILSKGNLFKSINEEECFTKTSTRGRHSYEAHSGAVDAERAEHV